MYKFTDLTGQVYGERVVVRLSHQHPVSKNYYWVARCSCGREDVVSGSRLKKGTKCLSCSGRINGRVGLNRQSEDLPCYFIRCGDYLKVGSSSNPERRLKDMMSNNPYPLELLWVDYDKGENYWHDRLKGCLHRGEWYYYNKVCEIVDIT